MALAEEYRMSLSELAQEAYDEEVKLFHQIELREVLKRYARASYFYMSLGPSDLDRRALAFADVKRLELELSTLDFNLEHE